MINEEKIIKEIMLTTGISYDKAYRIFNPTFYDYIINIKDSIIKCFKKNFEHNNIKNRLIY